jgi:hypothetical protein
MSLTLLEPLDKSISANKVHTDNVSFLAELGNGDGSLGCHCLRCNGCKENGTIELSSVLILLLLTEVFSVINVQLSSSGHIRVFYREYFFAFFQF